MKKLLNTLYVVSPDAYLSLTDENVTVSFEDETKTSIPLHTLQAIVCFSRKGATPALLGMCARNGIRVSFFTPSGFFSYAVDSECSGNVLLRREQYRIADEEIRSIFFARNMITGKLYNEKYVLLRCIRDHEMRVDVCSLRGSAQTIQEEMEKAKAAMSKEELRGLEGNAAAAYFGAFDQMILQSKNDFFFHERNRRPPADRINALLSFSYSLLANDCASALRGVGLDPYVGFLHADRPGRTSLALDLMEELRPVFADRFVLTLVNNRILNAGDFDLRESGAVLLSDEARKKFLSEWQKKKREEITHPFLGEKIAWGLVPHVQAQLLARTIRGDLSEYPPFFWK